MNSTTESKNRREAWFSIAKPLNKQRATLLSTLSFLLPLIVWCLISYTPFLWHPDVKLDLGGVFGSTVYTSGDHVRKGYLPDLVASTQAQNLEILKQKATGEARSSKRGNLKIIRRLSDILVVNEVIAAEEQDSDSAVYAGWGLVANNPNILRKRPLTPENIAIVRENWAELAAQSTHFEKTKLPTQPLLNLLPQGRPANPVFLPAPHEVILTGIHDWRAEPTGDKPSMLGRYLTSLRTVFLGFLIAAAIAVPIGVVAGTYDVFAKLFEPFWDFFRYMPAPAFGTLLVAILGAHQSPKVALVFIGTFPHLLLMLTKTVRMVDTPLLEAAQTLGAKGNGLLTRVVVPASLPSIYNDLRIALGWAWTWLVIAELIGVKAGLTEIIDTQGVRRNFDRVYPVIILIGITGFMTDQALAYLKTKLFPWQSNEG
ncbi:ABC transporter permease [Rubritalea marina]|uniref:ABC transporter permease n=1 Tax=Rubritalea marina TaxID=361055 RepID=UPI0003664F79|nr:ABC transporter permease [Rubritalea marina]